MKTLIRLKAVHGAIVLTVCLHVCDSQARSMRSEF